MTSLLNYKLALAGGVLIAGLSTAPTAKADGCYYGDYYSYSAPTVIYDRPAYYYRPAPVFVERPYYYSRPYSSYSFSFSYGRPYYRSYGHSYSYGRYGHSYSGRSYGGHSRYYRGHR